MTNKTERWLVMSEAAKDVLACAAVVLTLPLIFVYVLSKVVIEIMFVRGLSDE